MKFNPITFLVLIVCSIPFLGKAQNPIIQTSYTADPAPLVVGDTMYLYTGHDEDKSTWFVMKDWHVFASADMVNWIDKGVGLSLKDIPWAKTDAWAAQCIERNGKFYWYYCAKDTVLNRMAIGVAVADKPDGPFRDALGKPLVANAWGDIDPTVFIDTDGQAYMYWGNPDLWYVKLNEDMISYDLQLGVVKVPLTPEGFYVRTNDPKRASSYEEGPWLYKRKAWYYLLYPAGGVPEHLAYSMASSPEGPWLYQDTIMAVIDKGGAFTNHPGLVDFKDHTYLFYHNGALPGGGGFTRSVCVEEIQFTPDGKIPEIFSTREGIVQGVADLNPFVRQQAETIAWSEGVKTSTEANRGVVVNDLDPGDYIRVRQVNFGEGAQKFEASFAGVAKGATLEIRVDSLQGEVLGICKPKAKKNWKTTNCTIKPLAGTHDLYFVVGGKHKNAFRIDWWKFEAK